MHKLKNVVRAAIRWADAAFGPARIHDTVRVGEGTELGYGGLGIAISEGVEIGSECFIAHGVTLERTHAGAPKIGNRVYIGAGATILGPVVIADYAVIGANAVVESDVARGAIVGGIPARELRRDPQPEVSYAQWLSSQKDKRGEAEEPLPAAEAGAR